MSENQSERQSEKSSVSSQEPSPRSTPMQVTTPYTPIQQAMFARRTKAFDMTAENKLRDKILALSIDLDRVDQLFYEKLFIMIKKYDEAIYNELLSPNLNQSPLTSFEMHATDFDYRMDHMELLSNIKFRADSQREALVIDTVNRLKALRQVCFVANDRKLDQRRIDFLLFDLEKCLKEMKQDEHAERKARMVRECHEGMMEIKRGQLANANMLEKGLGGEWPPVDVVDAGADLKVMVHVPGFSKDEIFIDVTESGKQVILTGKFKEMHPNLHYLKEEIKKADFKRVIDLNSEVDPAKIVAEFVDGVLHLTLPKVNWQRVNINWIKDLE